MRTDPTAPKHRGISLLIIDMDTPGIDVRPLRHINGKADFAEVFFTDVVVPRENLVGELNGGWTITQGSLAHERAGLWVEGVSRLEQTVFGLVELAKRTGRDLDPVVRRRIAAAYEMAASLRALGYKGFASFAQGSSAPEHSFMKMATSETGKAVFELGMEICGPFGAVTDAERRPGSRTLGQHVLHELRQHDRGRQLRDPAQHHRPTRPRAPEEVGPWISRSPPTKSCCATPRAQLLADECPPTLLRAHMDDRAAATPLWNHLREFAALGTGRRDRPVRVRRADRLRRRAGPVLRVGCALRAAARADRHPALDAVVVGEAIGTVAVAGASGNGRRTRSR